MTNVISGTTADAVTMPAKPNRRRRARAVEPHRKVGRRRRLGFYLAALVMIAAAVPAALWFQEPPRHVPPFEAVVDNTPGPVKDFTLTDVTGAAHSTEEWNGRPGIVLVFLGKSCPVTDALAPEIARLAQQYGKRGVPFYGLYCDPDLTAESAASHASARDLAFPILLDPDQRIARQAGVRTTPEAVVLAPDGQVLYHGRINDLYTATGHRQRSARTHDLASALDAIAVDELPRVNHIDTFGSPLATRQGAIARLNQAVTFTRDIAPILYNNCAKCHRPGAVGPFSLLTYNDAAKRADFLVDVVTSGQMPPWKPHPGAGVFLDAPRLSSVEKETLARWAEAGRPRGNPADLPPAPHFNDGWQLGTPDAVLTPKEPFKLDASGKDLYWAFALPVNLGRDVVINGLEFRPGNRRIVHHSRIYLDTTGDARRRDEATAGAGFLGHVGAPGAAELPYPGLGGWTPGMTPRLAPDGVGRLLPAGSDVVLRVHYHSTGKPEEDRPSIGLFAKKEPVTRNMVGYTYCSNKIDIPPGDKRHTIIISSRIKADVHLYTVVPHAHYLCREFRLAATFADGTVQPLLWIKDWNLDWQDQYRYLKPVRLPKGTLLTLSVFFDNSEDNPRNPFKPPRRIGWGLGTNDEMCACHFEFLPDDPSGYAAYPEKSPFGL